MSPSNAQWCHAGAVEAHGPRAADFWVHSDETDVFSFGFGVRSQWEFPYELRYRNGEKDVLTEIQEMCRAVIEGRCEERRGWFSLKGSICVEELEQQNPTEEPVHQQGQVSTTDPDSTYATKGGTPARLGYYNNYLVDNQSCEACRRRQRA